MSGRLLLPAEPKPESLTALVDSREQLPLCLEPLRTRVATLATGDYSLSGLQDVIAIERKSESDLLGCVGGDRERFEREIQRLLAFPCRALIVESSWQRMEAGEWRSKVTPAAAVGSLLGWVSRGLPVCMVDTHERAGRYVAKLLFLAARRRWRESRWLIDGVLATEVETEAVT